ncbi:hypothetical protein POSPLADRAFT_1140739 [Rhizophagus irregularis DAOM 181602=DAOM 197198]|nr:hypothetical protein POSPLADRAFT_1140739 [Rhizophagus irregularis DAOM 181602=DAOM 197198]
MTPSHKEYLYQLSDLSENSHTAEYLVMVIEKVIEGIGKDRIYAVVSNNMANVHNAQKLYMRIIQRLRMYILSI